MGTTLIRGGKIIDGTGAKAYDGHVLFDGEKITAIVTDGSEPKADTVVDAKGCVVSPGFIDMHSHGDWVLALKDHDDLMKCFVEQGVTSIVGGNCGFSPAPINPETLSLMDKSVAKTIVDRPLDFSWGTMGEYLDHIEELEPIVNMAELVGHASVRIACGDTRRGALGADGMKKSLESLKRSLEEGACGLSFGLGYDPGMYSPMEEIEAFAKVAADAGKPVTVHNKALSLISPTYPFTYLKPHNLRALAEMIDVAKKTGAKLQISHLIYVGRRSWGTHERCLKMIDDARAAGVDVMFDALPYTSGNTTINVPMPYWFLALGEEGYRSAWARTRLRAELEIGFRLVGFMFKDFQIMNSAASEWDDLNGLTIEQVAKKWNTSAFDAMLKISEKTSGEATILFHTYSGEPGNETPLEATLAHKACLFESDALVKSKGYPNPAAMGTFPRILGYLRRERKLFSLEDAVHRMTGASAARFGIADRGTIATGKAADIVVFDPEKISDTPPVGSQPAGKPKGIEHVFINGAHVVKAGAYQPGKRVGRVVRT